MAYITRLLVNLSLLVYLCAAVSAQKPVAPGPPPAPVTVAVSLTAAGLRFTALGPVRQTRLEVFDVSGAAVFDSGFLPGGVRNWSPQQAGQTTPVDGTYQCVVTARDLSGRLSLKQGAVEVASGQVALRLGEAEGAGEVERRQDALSPVGGERPALAITAHDGRDGHVASTAGDLTLRTGDFFSGKDKEQMRITEYGRVGIGTDKPAATLDVAGTVRVSEGVRFSDGTTLNAASGRLTVRDAKGDSVDVAGTKAAGTGTQNRVAKWTETGGAGTLGDSAITEVSGRVGIGVTNPSYRLVVGPDIGPGLTTSDLTVSRGPGQSISAFVGASGANGMNFGWDQANQRAFVNAPVQSPITYTHGGVTERMRIATSGNVGIGTPTPGAKLDVAGAQPPPVSSGDGTNAIPVLQVIGGNGGTTTRNNSNAGAGASVITRAGNGGSIGVEFSEGFAGAGGSVFTQAGDGGAGAFGYFGGDGGLITLQAGAGSGDGNGGSITLQAGAGSGDGNGGSITLQPGTGQSNGNVMVRGGAILLDNNQGLFLKDAAGAQKRALMGDASNILRLGSGGGLGFDEIRFDVGSFGESMTINANGDVGIGTITPNAKLQVQGGHIYVGSAGNGIILKSPNGAVCRRLTVDDAGNLINAAFTCP